MRNAVEQVENTTPGTPHTRFSSSPSSVVRHPRAYVDYLRNVEIIRRRPADRTRPAHITPRFGNTIAATVILTTDTSNYAET